MNFNDSLTKDKVLQSACLEIANILLSDRKITRDKLDSLKRSICKKYDLGKFPSNSMILSYLPNRKRFTNLLKVKPVRTASGIAVIALMTKPYPCPHGSCIYCPGGYKHSSPQSYTGQEPAALRGAQNDFDPYRQVYARLEQFKSIGHDTGKVEIIIMGGTFLNFPIDYQKWFIKRCYDALNGFNVESLEIAKKYAEIAKIRNVGMTIETRPDFCKEHHVNLMLDYGVTRVEIGVQHTDDKIYKLVKRGHSLEDVIEAFRIAKDSSLKIVAHMMPGMPGSDPDKDFDTFYRLFHDPDFKPDMLKIYPTLVIESSELYKWYLKGIYKPYDDDTTIKLLAKIKSIVPKWVRIMRIQRDIPAKLIVDGIRKSNLREHVQKELLKMGKRCQCIRCREVGLKQVKHGIKVNNENVKLFKEKYKASKGEEYFISFEDISNEILIGFIRLRYPSEKAHRTEIQLPRTCLIRELHVYGNMVPVGKRDANNWQHKGFGSELLKEAEMIAKEDFDAKKIVVISAIGSKEYFRSRGYISDGPYMIKNFV